MFINKYKIGITSIVMLVILFLSGIELVSAGFTSRPTSFRSTQVRSTPPSFRSTRAVTSKPLATPKLKLETGTTASKKTWSPPASGDVRTKTAIAAAVVGTAATVASVDARSRMIREEQKAATIKNAETTKSKEAPTKDTKATVPKGTVTAKVVNTSPVESEPVYTIETIHRSKRIVRRTVDTDQYTSHASFEGTDNGVPYDSDPGYRDRAYQAELIRNAARQSHINQGTSSVSKETVHSWKTLSVFFVCLTVVALIYFGFVYLLPMLRQR